MKPNTTVRDVMLPVDDVPTVHRDATLADAVRALADADRVRPEGRPSYRAVLVVNDHDEVVGKVGYLAFLRALEPGFEGPQDLATLDRAGVDPAVVGAISAHLRFWHVDLPDCCRRAAHTPVRDVMLEVSESLDENTPVSVAITTLVRLNTLSLPVVRGPVVIGLLRLADLYQLVAEMIVETGRQSADPTGE